MPGYEFTGTVKHIMEQQTFPSGFSKREFVVTSEDRYPQDIKFECVKDRCALLDNVSEGQRVTVAFDLRGNAYNDRYFVNLSAWKVNPAGEDSAGSQDHEFPPEDDGFPLDDDSITDPDVGF